jgi:hypothetical protein
LSDLTEGAGSNYSGNAHEMKCGSGVNGGLPGAGTAPR